MALPVEICDPARRIVAGGAQLPTDRRIACGNHIGNWFARSDRRLPGIRKNRMRIRTFRNSLSWQSSARWFFSLRPWWVSFEMPTRDCVVTKADGGPPETLQFRTQFGKLLP